jgi:hypothetical protein
MSCLIYRDETGHAGGAPSVAALQLALHKVAGPSVRPALPDAVGRAGLGRLAPVDGGLRAVHQRVLRAFAETGQAPPETDFDKAAAPFGTDGRTVLALLHAGDFLRLDSGGAIRAAYPFSAVPPRTWSISRTARRCSRCARSTRSELSRKTIRRVDSPPTFTRATLAATGAATQAARCGPGLPWPSLSR